MHCADFVDARFLRLLVNSEGCSAGWGIKRNRIRVSTADINAIRLQGRHPPGYIVVARRKGLYMLLRGLLGFLICCPTTDISLRHDTLFFHFLVV